MSQSRFFNFRSGSAGTSAVGLNGVEVDLPDTAPTNVKIQYSEDSAASLTFVPSQDIQHGPHSLIYRIPWDHCIEGFSVSGSGLTFEAPSDHKFGDLTIAIAGGNSNMGNVCSHAVSLATVDGEMDATGLRCENLSAASTRGAFHAPAAENVSLCNTGSRISAVVSTSATARFSLTTMGGCAVVDVPPEFDGEFSAQAMGGSIFANGRKLPQSFVRPANRNSQSCISVTCMGGSVDLSQNNAGFVEPEEVLEPGDPGYEQ